MFFNWFTRRKKAVLVACQDPIHEEDTADEMPETKLLSDLMAPRPPIEQDTLLLDQTLPAPSLSSCSLPKAYIIEVASGKKVPITQSHFVIGRHSESGVVQADMCTQDPMVSRRHAEIFFENEIFWIQDLDSLNGTFLAGKRLEPNTPQRLENGSRFRLYQTEYLFEIDFSD